MRQSLAGWVTLACLAAGCSDPFALPAPTITSVVDTVTVFAVSGTPVWRPSGYSLSTRGAIRIDQSSQTDFAYDIRDGVPVLLPGAVIGQPGANVDPGLRRAAQPFDSLKDAPSDGYITQDTIQVQAGEVFFMRGRIPGLCLVGLPIFGKLEVLDFDDAERSIRFQVLVNSNCGFKSLEPGLPTR